MLFRPPAPSPEYAIAEQRAEIAVGLAAMFLGGKGPATGGSPGPGGALAMSSALTMSEVRTLAGLPNLAAALGLQSTGSGPSSAPKPPPEDAQKSTSPERSPGKSMSSNAKRVQEAEHSVDEYLRSKGHRVEPNPHEGVDGAGRQNDRIIDGVPGEIKTVSGIKDTTSDGLSKAVANRVMNGRGQASSLIVDVRGQPGMTEQIAERAARRAYGADRATAGGASRGPIKSIRMIGANFDITVPPRE